MSHPAFGTARIYGGCNNLRLLSRAGSVRRDPLDSQPTDRLEERPTDDCLQFRTTIGY